MPYPKGKPQSEESKLKRSRALTGTRRPPFSKEWRYNLSLAHMGQTPWNKGKEITDLQYIQKMRDSHLGHTSSIETKLKKSIGMRGSKHPNWKGGITPLRNKIRLSFKYRQWRSDIFFRDDFTCYDCDGRGGILRAHHLIPFGIIIELNDIKTLEEADNCDELWSLNNGITLCVKCHRKRHGKHNNSR